MLEGGGEGERGAGGGSPAACARSACQRGAGGRAGEGLRSGVGRGGDVWGWEGSSTF